MSKVFHCTLTPSQLESCVALSMFLLSALVTNTTGTWIWLSRSTSFLNALRAASSTSVPRASTPSMSKQIPNFGFANTTTPNDTNQHAIIGHRIPTSCAKNSAHTTVVDTYCIKLMKSLKCKQSLQSQAHKIITNELTKLVVPVAFLMFVIFNSCIILSCDFNVRCKSFFTH